MAVARALLAWISAPGSRHRLDDSKDWNLKAEWRGNPVGDASSTIFVDGQDHAESEHRFEQIRALTVWESRGREPDALCE